MSDYNPTYTRQYHDYAVARASRMEKRKEWESEHPGEIAPFNAHLGSTRAPLVTEERPNPLSVELRIVLVYFWKVYKGCVECDKYVHISENRRAQIAEEKRACLLDVRNICWDLFSPASPHSHIHIHSQYGCNNDDCPLWGLGYEAAQENVLDWYEPNN